jgi:hypothetical protein
LRRDSNLPVAPGISLCPACGHKIERKNRKILIGSGIAVTLLLLVVFLNTRSWKPALVALDAQLSALSQTITPGRSAVLSRRTQGTTSVTIEPGIGPVEPVGARAVTPRKTTTYTLVASNGSTSVSKQLIVTVARSSMHGADKPSSLPQPAGQQQTSRTAPTVLLMANGQQDSATIEEGEQLRLQWNVPGATSVVIQPMVGRVQPSGSSTGNLSSDTTFTLTAIGQGGTTVKTLAVTVAHHAPTLWIKANGSENSTTINLGQAVHICWQAQYADSASLLYQGKSVSVPVTNCFDPKPFTDTTYPITATGKGGNISALVLVHVKLPTQSLRPTPALTPRSGSFSWTGEIDKKKFVRILLMFQKNGAMTPRSFPSGSFSPSLTYQGAAFYGTFPSGITVSSESSQFVVDSVTSGQSGSDLATVYYYVVTVHCQKKGLQKIDLNWRSK